MPSSGIAPAPPPDPPRRCFICLTDEDPSDPPSSWVDPCPCTLEAHQDCMLSWVTDCERSNKPLICPVCKSKIRLETPWEPIVDLSESIARSFTRASPLVLLGSTIWGVQVSCQTYGSLAMWAFSGREALLKYVLGPDMVIDGSDLKFPMPLSGGLAEGAMLTCVAPVLLLGQLMPWLSNKAFIPTAFVCGIYHVMREDDFLSWPPSPKLAMVVFPYIRTTYLSLWREFVFPYEVNLNRKIMGLPPVEREDHGQGNIQQERVREANGEGGGVLGFLQGMIDALEGDGEQEEGENLQGAARAGIEIEDGGMVVELVIEEVELGAEDSDEEFIGFDDEPQRRDIFLDRQPAGRPAAPRPAPRPEGEQAAPAPAQQPAERPAEQPGPRQNHEVPQAPARRPTLGGILSSVSNAIVSSLILPGVSWAMGELIRLALPRSWTVYSAKYGRPGFLQQQWGRSLVGGCLYIVIKDAVRFYSKYRRVAAMENRRVKDVQRRRNRK